MHTINIDILSHKEIEDKIWYLCKGNLLEYLSNLKEDFYDFAIQRRIVKNQYLDSLYFTVKSGDPIPMITLTCNKPYLISTDFKSGTLDLSKIEILDGLQRTFRLWTYKALCDHFEAEQINDALALAKSIKSKNELFFESGVLSTSKIRELIESKEIEKINSVFSKFEVYFVIWAGLDERQIIQKMLQLNAGQKSVSKTHQFELLFLHFYDELISDANAPIKLVREKDPAANVVKKGEGEIGQFMFSSIIVALQSFVEQKPLRISTENLIGNEAEDETSPDIYKSVFTTDFIKMFVGQLTEIEDIIAKKEQINGKEWFVKDTTLSGIFAAVGKSIDFKNLGEASIADEAKFKMQHLKTLIEERGLNLDDFKKQYNFLSSRAGNIGIFIRNVIENYFSNFLNNGNADWVESFNGISERNKK